MLSKGTTRPSGAPQRAPAAPGSKASTITDRRDEPRSASESAAVARGEGAPAESHWESVIDRATD
jgi:hypothetical protein